MKNRYTVLIAVIIFVITALSSCFLFQKPLTPPQLLSPANGATNASTTLTLIWSTSNLKANYELFFGTNKTPTFAESTSSTSAVEKNLAYSTTYYWEVAAISREKAATSSVFSFTTVRIPKPSAPVLSVASALTDSVSLGWTRSEFASSVEIYGAASGAFTKYATLPGTSTSLTANGLSPSVVYKFFAVGINASGRATSNTVTAVTLSIPAIDSFSVTSVSTDTATLGWKTSNASAVYLYSSPSDSVLATITDGSTSYAIKNLTPSTSYKYFIVAVNPSGRATSDTIPATTFSYTKTAQFEIYMGDKPVSQSEIQNLYVTLTGFSVHAAFGETSAWYTSSASETYDLTTLVGTFVGVAKISIPASAIVTQLRFNILSATVVINGASHSLDIPSSAVYLNAQSVSAQTLEGEYLDFDISQSVENAGNGYIFNPVIHIVGGNTRASVTGYVVYRSQPVSIATVSIEDSSVIVADTYTLKNGNFTIGAVDAGDYTLKVDADATGAAEYSTFVSLSKGNNDLGMINLSQIPPATPILTVSTSNPHFFVLKWTSCANADGYHVWESAFSTSAMVQTATLPSTSTSFEVPAKPGEEHYFAVSSYNSAGQRWSRKLYINNTPPSLKLMGIPSTIVTTKMSTDATVTITAIVGNSEGGNRIASVTVNNIAATFVSPGEWSARIHLSAVSNPNTIIATAIDLYGNASETSSSVELTQTVTATISVGNSPWGVAVDSDTHTVYVANNSENTVSVINGDAVTAAISVGRLPWGVAVDSDTHTVYVTNNSYPGSVGVINGDTVDATITVGNYPYGVGIAPNTDMVYVINYDSTSVSVIDGISGDASYNTVVATITKGIGTNPFGVGIDPDTKLIYVTNLNSSSISVIEGNSNDASYNTVVATINISVPNVHPEGIGIDPATHMIYVASGWGWSFAGTSIVAIDGNPGDVDYGKVIGTIPVGLGPMDVRVNSTTHMIYAANSLSDSVSVIDGNPGDANYNKVVETIPVKSGPINIGIDPMTNMIYVANSSSNSVSVIDGNP